MRLSRLVPGRASRPVAGEVSAAATGPPVRVLAGLGVVVAGCALGLFVVLAAVVTRSAGRDRWDLVVRQDLLRHAGRGAAALADVGDDLSAPAVLAVATVLAAVVLWRWAHRPLLSVGVLAVTVSTGALVELLALAFSGVRPATRTVLGLPVFDGSFPSVRTAEGEAFWGALVLAGVLLAHRGATRVVCLVVGVLLSAVLVWAPLDRARVWPTDVLGGWLLGIAAVGVAAALLAAWPSQPAVPAAPAPAAVPVVPVVGGPDDPAGAAATHPAVRGTTLNR